jgi:glucosamine-phosphate N-acetyltransferase
MIVRPVQIQDCQSIMELYAEFTGETNTLTVEDFIGFLAALNDNHHLYVIETLEGTVVGCATLLLEYKLIHGGSCIAHVEDVIVATAHRGKGYGRLLIMSLVNKAKAYGCYKIILDCDDATRPFYENCGFQQKNIQMAIYFN